MALDPFDTGVGYSFAVRIDGHELPRVMEVSGLKIEVDRIEVKQNSADGKFKITHLPGRQKAGQVTITRGLDQVKGGDTWLKKLLAGDVKGARATAEISILDTMNAPIKTYKLRNAWVMGIETGTLKAGDTNAMTEKWTVTYEEIEVE